MAKVDQQAFKDISDEIYCQDKSGDQYLVLSSHLPTRENRRLNKEVFKSIDQIYKEQISKSYRNVNRN